MQKTGSLLGGILLVAGTCIGGGMLALPVLTALGGFIPTLVIYVLCWALMAATGLLFLEICHNMEGEVNFITMAEQTLGKAGKAITWTVYLFLFYCLCVAYVVGCGHLVTEIIDVSPSMGSVIFVALFSPIIFAGSRFVGRINAVLMIGLGVSFLGFIALGHNYVNPEFLTEKNWALSTLALPIAFTSFGYQGIVPTLSTYFGKDLRRTRIAILIGSFLPFFAYAIWEWLILGIVPVHGPGGLQEALMNGQNAVQPLKYFIQNPTVYFVGQNFAFFALTTSFLGVAISLQDFLSDGFQVSKSNLNTIAMTALVFLPPLAIALINPNIFLVALDIAGGFGAAIILVLLPISMAWAARYKLGWKGTRCLPGGKAILIVMALFVLFEIALDIYKIFI